jgi:hypothetical protein
MMYTHGTARRIRTLGIRTRVADIMPAVTDTWRDRIWMGLLTVAFAAGLAVSWQRWGNPLIDTGREMNQPLRLVDGETLYANVRHIYGPLSPWLHAALYRLFGPSLSVLYIDGIISTAIILALVYRLGRQIMTPAAAGAATLCVMWLCALRPAGNYILPYSYDSLHATVLSLIALAVLVKALRAPPHSSGSGRGRGAIAFLIAGLLAGLTLLAKTEIGFATMVAGLTAAALVARQDMRRGAGLATLFVTSAICLALGVYGSIAMRVGWSTLISDSWLLLYNIPPELTFYNRRVSGFDHPLRSIERMLIAAVKIGLIAATVAAISILVARRRGSAPAVPSGRAIAMSHPWRLLAAALAVLIATAVTTGFDWDKGPFLAMPFLLVGLLAMLLTRLRADATPRTAILIVCTVYALACLARMILHVRSGGAYGSFLLPMSVIIFTYLWVGPFPASFADPRAGRVARAFILFLILGDIIATAAIFGYRYQTRNITPIATPRGRMMAERDLGQAWNEALAYIDEHTRPGDAVAVLPEGTSLDFLSGRRNPLREEIATPGFLASAAEGRAIEQLQASHTDLILITNRLTAEFGPAVFGRDYSQQLMGWIDAHYTTCAMFGPIKDQSLQIGARSFFIRAYCLDNGSEARARANASPGSKTGRAY